MDPDAGTLAGREHLDRRTGASDRRRSVPLAEARRPGPSDCASPSKLIPTPPQRPALPQWTPLWPPTPCPPDPPPPVPGHDLLLETDPSPPWGQDPPPPEASPQVSEHLGLTQGLAAPDSQPSPNQRQRSAPILKPFIDSRARQVSGSRGRVSDKRSQGRVGGRRRAPGRDALGPPEGHREERGCGHHRQGKRK